MINPEKARRFSRNHGLPANDAAFFNESEILRELAEKEDFIVIGRCADVILKNNNIPHVSVFITAPVQQRARRIRDEKPYRTCSTLSDLMPGYPTAGFIL